MSIRTRVLLVGILLVALFVITGYASALSFMRVSRTMGAALRNDQEATALLSTLAAVLEDEDDVLIMSLSGGAADYAQLDSLRTRFDAASHRLDALTVDPTERALLSELILRAAAYRNASDVMLAASGSERARVLYRDELSPLLRQATADCGRLREHRFRATEDIASVARDEAARATLVVSAASVGSLCLLGLIAWHVARSVLAPLSELTRAVDAMTDGDFERRVTLSTGDELSALGAGFNRMAEAVGAFRRSKLGEVMAANATLEGALEALPEVVLVLDCNGRLLKTNAQARALFDEWLGETPGFVTELPFGAMLRQRLDEARATSGASTGSRADLGRSIAIRVKDEERRFSLRVVCVRREEGPVDAVVVLDDVTDFARLDDMRTEFVAAASHELRTPLTTLQMTLALLAEGAHRFSDAERETIATAQLGFGQLAATVDEFLDLATLDAGRIVYERVGIDVASLIRRVTPLFAPRFEERRVTLAMRVEEGLPAVTGDATRLAAALSNVLGNALKYSPAEGIVEVVASADASRVEIAVSDQGPGVPDALRERIFEKYFRVEHQQQHAGTTSIRGAGIGLYLCRQIVEAHSGAVRCERAPGGGARLVMTLPSSTTAAQRIAC